MFQFVFSYGEHDERTIHICGAGRPFVVLTFSLINGSTTSKTVIKSESKGLKVDPNISMINNITFGMRWNIQIDLRVICIMVDYWGLCHDMETWICVYRDEVGAARFMCSVCTVVFCNLLQQVYDCRLSLVVWSVHLNLLLTLYRPLIRISSLKQPRPNLPIVLSKFYQLSECFSLDVIRGWVYCYSELIMLFQPFIIHCRWDTCTGTGRFYANSKFLELWSRCQSFFGCISWCVSNVALVAVA